MPVQFKSLKSLKWVTDTTQFDVLIVIWWCKSSTFIIPTHCHKEGTFLFKLGNSSAGMLPKPVADDLRQGRTTDAQSFTNATVYFRFALGSFPIIVLICVNL